MGQVRHWIADQQHQRAVRVRITLWLYYHWQGIRANGVFG